MQLARQTIDYIYARSFSGGQKIAKKSIG